MIPGNQCYHRDGNFWLGRKLYLQPLPTICLELSLELKRLGKVFVRSEDTNQQTDHAAFFSYQKKYQTNSMLIIEKHSGKNLRIAVSLVILSLDYAHMQNRIAVEVRR